MRAMWHYWNTGQDLPGLRDTRFLSSIRDGDDFERFRGIDGARRTGSVPVIGQRNERQPGDAALELPHDEHLDVRLAVAVGPASRFGSPGQWTGVGSWLAGRKGVERGRDRGVGAGEAGWFAGLAPDPATRWRHRSQ